MKKNFKEILERSLNLLEGIKMEDDRRELAENIILDSYNRNSKKIGDEQALSDFEETSIFIFRVIENAFG